MATSTSIKINRILTHYQLINDKRLLPRPGTIDMSSKRCTAQLYHDNFVRPIYTKQCPPSLWNWCIYIFIK